jgi:hypothetical protein
MGRAEYLYERLKEEGEAAIDQMILDRESESFFLDFKRSSDNGEGRRFSDPDRRNLAKAISGFGNSEGGLIIWGVDCSDAPHEGDHADVARAKFPIADVDRFKSWLEGSVSGCTVPPHPSVEHLAIKTGEGPSGFVASLIPQSTAMPHQVIMSSREQYRYYIRAGSDFVPAPHGILAGMFGRKPQPNLSCNHWSEPNTVVGETLQSNRSITLINEGPGIATAPYLQLTIWSKPGHNSSIRIDNADDEVDWQRWCNLGSQFVAMGKSHVRIPPGFNRTPYIIRLSLQPPFENELRIEGICGCNEGPPVHFTLRSDERTIERLYQKALEDEEGQKYQVGIWEADKATWD